MVLVHTQVGRLTVLEQMCDVRTTGYHNQQFYQTCTVPSCAFSMFLSHIEPVEPWSQAQ